MKFWLHKQDFSQKIRLLDRITVLFSSKYEVYTNILYVDRDYIEYGKLRGESLIFF